VLRNPSHPHCADAGEVNTVTVMKWSWFGFDSSFVNEPWCWAACFTACLSVDEFYKKQREEEERRRRRKAWSLYSAVSVKGTAGHAHTHTHTHAHTHTRTHAHAHTHTHAQKLPTSLESCVFVFFLPINRKNLFWWWDWKKDSVRAGVTIRLCVIG